MDMKIYEPRRKKYGEKGDAETNNFITIPVTYPDRRYPETKTAIPSDENVHYAKEWVEYDQL